MSTRTKPHKSPPREPDQRDPILDRLDLLISLVIAPAKKHADEVSSLQYEILRFCDYNHTTEEIAKATKKTANHIKKELSLLRSKGLVMTVTRAMRSVHVRL